MRSLTPLLLLSTSVAAQNLPSLLKGKNVYSTFSITAYDSAAQEWGIAVATHNIYVGNSTVYVEPGLGAFSVIAETEPSYAFNGFKALRAGKTIREAIEQTRKADTESYSRQVAGIDARGNVYAFTGSTWKYQQGFAGALMGKNYIVMGNQLGDSVLTAMATTFEKTMGTLAVRLTSALIAGEKAGGQIEGKQSAALAVKGANNDFFNNIDLRVDDSRDPFDDLQRLLNYHYGRIRLNQAIFAIKAGNLELGKTRLSAATSMVKGWNGMQGKLAMAYILLGENAKAVAIIRAALAQNPQWNVYLPAFYCLKDEPGMHGLIRDLTFTEKDWCSAVSLDAELNRNPQAAALAKVALQKFPNSSYLHFLLGQSLLNAGNKTEAKDELRKAVSIDPANDEAVQLLNN